MLLLSSTSVVPRLTHLSVHSACVLSDCYVAVVGLPEARKDHAIVMARFARECVTGFGEVVKTLQMKLGPDTSELGVRYVARVGR